MQHRFTDCNKLEVLQNTAVRWFTESNIGHRKQQSAPKHDSSVVAPSQDHGCKATVTSQLVHRGNQVRSQRQCQTCQQDFKFTGAALQTGLRVRVRPGLAGAWWSHRCAIRRRRATSGPGTPSVTSSSSTTTTAECAAFVFLVRTVCSSRTTEDNKIIFEKKESKIIGKSRVKGLKGL